MKKTICGKAAKLSRRTFIVGSAAAGGGLALGFNLPSGFGSAMAQSEGAEVNAWVFVKPDDTCVIRIARSEMGQGTITGLVQLVAEELECDWTKVKAEQITPGQNLARKRVWGDMSTGGSRGIRGSQDYVRRGAAAARIMLLQAATEEWKVPVAELTVADGVITHAASGRSLSYGKLAAAAAKLEPPDPKAIKLKDPKDWKIAGKAVKRIDTADKLDGSKIYAIDIQLPNMLCAAIKDCPVFGGKVASYDEAKIASRPGVRKVVKVKDTAVAVVADTWWRAKTALDALPIVWDGGPNASVSSASIAEQLKEGLTATVTNGDRRNGDALRAIESAAKKVEAVYSTPFLAHATMEPMNATVRLSAEKAEVWVATQNAEASMAALSEASGVPLAKCEVYRSDLGGGFGRRGGTQDYVHQAVAIAKEFPGVPIKLIWSREEDQAHDFFRPISQCGCAAGLDAHGNLVGLHVRVCGQSINATLNPAGIVNGRDRRQLQGLWEEPGDAQLGYTVPNLLTEYVMRNTHVPVGPWRGVNTNQNGVYMECFIMRVRPTRTRSSSAARSWATIPSISRCSTPRRRRATGASRCLPASIAGSPSSWVTAATRPPSPRSRSATAANSRSTAWYSRSIAGTPSRRLRGLWAHRHALRRVQGQGWADGGFELRQLSDHAACGNAEGGNGDRAEPRFLGRCRRADDLRGGARGAQRHPCRDRQAGAPAATEEHQAGLGWTF